MQEKRDSDQCLLLTGCHSHHRGNIISPLSQGSHHYLARVFRRKTCLASMVCISMACALMSLSVLTLCLTCPVATRSVQNLPDDESSFQIFETEPAHVNYRAENDLSSKFQGFVSGPAQNDDEDIEQRIQAVKAKLDRFRITAEENDNDDEDYDAIAQNKASPIRRLPEAIIIGVKKAGTRALLEFLRIHPDVRAPGPEPHFFDRYYERGYDWYRRQMPASLDGQLTMEKSPSYFITKEAPGRIKKMNPDIKLILVVRDPVTRAISDYTQALSKRNDVKPFEHMAFVDNVTGMVDTSWGAIKIGIYAKHFDRWLNHFPLSQIHIVNGEKLIEEPAKEMAKVQSFLQLKTVINDKHFYFNATKGFPCLKKPEHSGNPHCLGRTKGRPHPEINPVALQRLKNFFRPFNQKFYQMVGQDFGWD